jgi:hypothetical protein
LLIAISPSLAFLSCDLPQLIGSEAAAAVQACVVIEQRNLCPKMSAGSDEFSPLPAFAGSIVQSIALIGGEAVE